MIDQRFMELPIAHRALHDVQNGRPENSRAAILAAIDHGFGIEIDLQLSSDGQAMVFHDYQLNRLAHATGPVRQVPSSDLAKIELRGGSDTIPSFSQVLEWVDGRVPILVELKDQDGAMGNEVGELERAVAEATSGYAGPLAFMSFNPNSVAEMANLAPNVPRGLVTDPYDPADWILPKDVCQRLRSIPDFDRVGASFISHSVTDLDNPRVAELKRKGVPILCWTVTSADMEKEARIVADNITFEQYLPV